MVKQLPVVASFHLWLSVRKYPATLIRAGLIRDGSTLPVSMLVPSETPGGREGC